MATRIALAVLIFGAFAFGQSTSAAETTEYPTVTYAEVPLYPAIARAAHISGTVEIQITVEKGAVVHAQVKSVVLGSSNGAVLNDEGKKKVGLYLSNPAVANVKTWRFQPQGGASFLVTYVYKIEGEQTSLPENPKVEMDLPRRVTVTAKPSKPYCSDGCG